MAKSPRRAAAAFLMTDVAQGTIPVRPTIHLHVTPHKRNRIAERNRGRTDNSPGTAPPRKAIGFPNVLEECRCGFPALQGYHTSFYPVYHGKKVANSEDRQKCRPSESFSELPGVRKTVIENLKDTPDGFLSDYLPFRRPSAFFISVFRVSCESATFSFYCSPTRASCLASRSFSRFTSSSGSSRRSMGPKERMRISSSVSSSFR